MRFSIHRLHTTTRALLLPIAALFLVLLPPDPASAQRSRMPLSRSRMSTGAVTHASPPPSTPSPPSTSTGGGYSGYSRSASFGELEAARSRHFFRTHSLYGRWCSGYVPYLCRQSKGSFVSITTLAAPKTARKAYKKATKEMNKGTPDFHVAVRHLEQALAEYPEYAAAWTLLGRVRRRAGDKQRAREAFQQAIELDPRYLEPYPQLAHMATEDKQWAVVGRLSAAMLKINPYFPLGHYYKGSALLKQGNLTDAGKALREALHAPDALLFPESHYMLGEVYREQRDVTLAAREYRIYAASARHGPALEEALHWLAAWEALGVIESEAARQKRKKK